MSVDKFTGRKGRNCRIWWLLATDLGSWQEWTIQRNIGSSETASAASEKCCLR
jgi:hypothetical protein